jgi:hypothetical protein
MNVAVHKLLRDDQGITMLCTSQLVSFILFALLIVVLAIQLHYNISVS